MFIKCEPGDTIPLRVQLWDRTTDKYPQAKLYDQNGNLVATKNLSHVADGLYQTTYRVDGTHKHLVAQYSIYTDSEHTTLASTADYSTGTDDIYCNYDFRVSMGAVASGLTKKDIKEIVEGIKNEIGADKIDDILKELRKKSEFNPQTDKVKTDLKIPSVNLREINETLREIKKIVSEKQSVDSSLGLIRLSKELKKIINDNTRKIREDIVSIIKQIKSIDIPNLNSESISKRLGQEFSARAINIQKSLLELEKMLEVLNVEDFKRVTQIIQGLDKIMKLQESINTAIVNLESINREKEIETSEILEFLQKNET